MTGATLTVRTVLVRETRQIHCPACKRFLADTTATFGVLRIKCPHCRAWKRIDVSTGQLASAC